MRRRLHPLRPLTVARVALCVVALLAQATLLPLAHLTHEAQNDRARVLAGSTRDAAAPNTVSVRSARPAQPAHDASTCPICATLAHGRAAIMTAVLGAPSPHAALSAPYVAPAAGSDAAPRAGGGPRAPPVLTA